MRNYAQKKIFEFVKKEMIKITIISLDQKTLLFDKIKDLKNKNASKILKKN